MFGCVTPEGDRLRAADRESRASASLSVAVGLVLAVQSRPMETREIVDDDFPDCVDIFTEAWNDLHRRHGYGEDVSHDDSWLLKPLTHFRGTDPNGGRIAVDKAGPVAFGSSASVTNGRPLYPGKPVTRSRQMGIFTVRVRGRARAALRTGRTSA